MSVSGSGTVNYGHVAQKDDQKIESYGLKELGWDKVPTGLNSFLCHSQNVPSGILSEMVRRINPLTSMVLSIWLAVDRLMENSCSMSF